MIINEALFMGIKELNNNNIEDSNLKARILISHSLNVTKEYILVHGEEEFPIEKINEYLENIERVAKGEPIQYVINSQDFYGLNFYINEDVLIPQPDTEVLVEEAIKLIRKENREIKILDLCTGSGAIAVCLAKEENVKVTASDISRKALEVAKRNATLNSVQLEFIESNLFENIKDKFDIIVSNPPYIETDIIDTLSNEVKAEPKIALDGGKDGLDFYRKIVKEARKYLKENGHLIVEIGYNQKESVIELFKENHFENVICIKDYGQNDRVIMGNI